MSTPDIPPSPSREEYARDYAAALAANSDEAEVACDEPFGLLDRWLGDARAHEINDPNAMALATVDAEGLPDCRMVLLKDVGPEGLTFYSNRESAKGRQLAGQPQAAVLFHWKSLRRQIRVRGPVEPVSPVGRLSSQPTHTTARRSPVNPVNQLSRRSLVVPVCPAICRSEGKRCVSRRAVPSRTTS